MTQKEQREKLLGQPDELPFLRQYAVELEADNARLKGLEVEVEITAGERDVVLKKLGELYDEKARAIGLLPRLPKEEKP